MAANGSVPAPALVWPGSTRSVTVRDADRGDVHLKLAQENETLQIWLEEEASRRQFYASLTGEECAEIAKDVVDPSNLSEMLYEALSSKGEKGKDLSATFEWHSGSVTLIMHLRPCKWMTKAFSFPLDERGVSQVDRLERRMDHVEARIQKQARHGEATCPDLSDWSLRVFPSYYNEVSEGVCGHFAFHGNYFLIQDVDYATKRTGVSTASGQHGVIQAMFQKPVHVNRVKIAAFPSQGWGSIADVNSLCMETLSPETGAFEVLRQNIPSITKEEEFPVGKVILSLRLKGTYMSISKLIFS